MDGLRITVKEFMQIVNFKSLKNYYIVDLRNENEYMDFHIPGAINIPFDKFINIHDFRKLFKYENIIILYCARGGSSIYAANYLAGYGFKVRSLIGRIVEYRKN